MGAVSLAPPPPSTYSGPSYACERDLYRFGMPRGLVNGQGRLVDASLAATSTITLGGHGFETGDEVVFRATEGGALSVPLAAGTTYYAIEINDWTFRVSTTPGGGPIALLTDGVSMLVTTPLPFDDVIQFYSRFVDAFLPAHMVPLTAPYPIVVVATVIELSSKKLLQMAGHASVSVDEAELAAKAQLERWARGLPLRDAAATAPANLAATKTLVKWGHDPRGWGSGILPDTLPGGRGWGNRPQ